MLLTHVPHLPTGLSSLNERNDFASHRLTPSFLPESHPSGARPTAPEQPSSIPRSIETPGCEIEDERGRGTGTRSAVGYLSLFPFLSLSLFLFSILSPLCLSLSLSPLPIHNPFEHSDCSRFDVFTLSNIRGDSSFAPDVSSLGFVRKKESDIRYITVTPASPVQGVAENVYKRTRDLGIDGRCLRRLLDRGPIESFSRGTSSRATVVEKSVLLRSL